MKHPYASANIIACAIISASDILGADPLDVADKSKLGGRRSPVTRARYVALAALRGVLPKCDQYALARGVGFKSPSSAITQLSYVRRIYAWWREDWVSEVISDLLEFGQANAPATPCAPLAPPAVAPETHSAPVPAPQMDHWQVDRRVAVRRSRASIDMGEPEAGRSALDMRRNGRGLPGELTIAERTASTKGAVTLPKLNFTEGRER